mgnify:CR=1 FL=1
MNEIISFGKKDPQAPDWYTDVASDRVRDKKIQEQKEDKWRRAPIAVNQFCSNGCANDSARKINGRSLCKSCFMAVA